MIALLASLTLSWIGWRLLQPVLDDPSQLTLKGPLILRAVRALPGLAVGSFGLWLVVRRVLDLLETRLLP
jgi:hypothetical protein